MLGIPITNRTVLMGAGFSKNYGGLLANEINDSLLVDHDVRACKRIKKLVRDNANYEFALATARQEGFDQEEIEALESAIMRVYQTQNAYFTDNQNQHYKAMYGSWGAQAFFGKLGWGNWSGRMENSAYIFTLNQDILMETLLVSGNTGNRPYCLPGIRCKDWYFQARTPYKEELHSQILVEDTQENVDAIEWRNHINIVKLHGSAEWKNQIGNLLVIGGQKELFIQPSPLLTRYQQVFREICTREGMRLLVIGYGFADPHINGIIDDGIDKGLELWVWDYGPRARWMERMRNYDVTFGERLIDATVGYTDADAKQVLHQTGTHVASFHPVLDSFFAN